VIFTIVYRLDIFVRQEYKNIFIKPEMLCQKEKGLLVGIIGLSETIRPGRVAKTREEMNKL